MQNNDRIELISARTDELRLELNNGLKRIDKQRRRSAELSHEAYIKRYGKKGA